MTRDSKARAGWHGLQRGLCAAALLSLASCTAMDDAERAAPGDREAPRAELAAPGHETASGGARAGRRKSAAFAKNEILVRFKSGTSLTSTFAAHAAHRTQLVRAYRVPSNLHLVQLPSDLAVDEAIEIYRRDPNVLYAEPNYRYQLLSTVPDDASFGDLWGMDNSGQTGGTADADINAPEAWDITTGSADVIIGVLDTGIDYQHEDLVDNVFVNPGEIPDNGVDDDGNGYVDDVHGISTVADSGDPMDDAGHGTHVSGTIAARGNNGIGVAGVNWQAKIVACKAFGPSGATLDDIMECMDYFLELKTRAEDPVDIVATNNSWGGGPFSQALHDAIQAHQQAGMLFVAAAGNDSGNDNDTSPHFPSNYDLDNVISVAATNHDDQLASFSNLGARTVDVGAPGQDILSTVPGNSYAVYSGTSMATPHVTGLVGLLAAQEPARGPQAIKNLILTGGQEAEGTRGTTLSGRRIRADRSLACEGEALLNRYAPAAASVVVGVGTPVPLGVLHIECETPASEPQSVTVTETGELIALVDASGSGRFEGVFTPRELGSYTLAFSSGGTVTVSAIANYDPAREVPFEYRTIAGTELDLNDDNAAEIVSPFPIQFGGAEPGLSSLYVGDNGVISFTEPVIAYFNQALPSDIAATLVAPYWDDLNPVADARVAYEVLGEEPHRELVIEWRDMRYFPDLGAATFQAVFFENSPNILFNYGTVVFGDGAVDNGASATIGVQISRDLAQQHSHNQASVSEGTALLFAMGAPMAVAGPDQAVFPGADVTLDGSASEDTDGTIVSYQWTQTGGETVALQGATEPVATFTAPQTPGTLSFELEVVDDDGQRSVDTIDVVVNLAPVADAGEDFMLGSELQGTLDAAASYDPDGLLVGYRWTQLGGEPVTLAGGDTPVATFTAPATAQYLTFQLTVTDEHGFTASDVIVVEVFHNDAPVARAGDDRILRPGSAATLDGTASSDPDGRIVSYDWQVSACVTTGGPCDLERDLVLRGADTATPVVIVPESPGMVSLTLTVTDDAGATASDSVVLGVFRQGPSAVASAGAGCAIAGSAITLDGTASSDPDGAIAAYRWTQVAGPAVTLSGADTAVATFTAPAAGTVLVFDLVVTDDDGLTGATRIEVPIDTPPVAAAEADALAAVAGATVTLDGSRSQDAAFYRWRQIGGPAAVLSDPTAASPTFVAPSPSGAYEQVTFELTVANACGAAATDTVTVVVVPGS